MIEFETYSGCELCSLYQSATNRGLPTRSLYDGQEVSKERAILFVGQSPGWREDKAGKSFAGYTGGLLKKLIEVADLPRFCDIYLTNACRCKPPQGANETQTHIRTCRPYLMGDVRILQGNYKEIIIVVLGAKACYAVTNISSLSNAFKKQGAEAAKFQGSDGVCPKVFFTYHPAILHKTRRPALITAVKAHFDLLKRYICGEFFPNSLKVEPLVGIPVPEWLPRYVRLDIETYGILAGKEQTVFNPHKSKYIDGVGYLNQIVTVSFAWRDIDRNLKTVLYKWDDPSHRVIIREWFKVICEERHILEGQNIKFDLAYLMMSGDKELRYWIQPERLQIDDTLLWAFLLFEQQPEKGLKELSTLFGIADYSGLKVTGSSGTAKSSNDKDLHYYNCLDGATTTVLHEELYRKIEEQFGRMSPKLSEECSMMRNMVLWDTIDLELNGSSFDLEKLQKYHDEEKSRCDDIEEICETQHGFKVAGKGSDKQLREFMYGCMTEAGLAGDKRVEFTGKTKKMSIGVENVNLFKKHLPEGEALTILSLFQEHKKRIKTVNTYTDPLLHKPRKGIVIKTDNIGIVYPTWYPIPSYHERGGGSEEKSGGQIQGRISCHKPARQTEPRRIRECSASRWEGGKLVEYDVSQDHLRMAALLSGDPFLMEVYLDSSLSLHTQSAKIIFPNIDPESFPSKKAWKKSNEYKTAKKLNFLTIFRGGAEAFQRVVLHDVGIELDIEFCRTAISRWFNKYNVYRAWQDRMIALATKQGYLVLPTGWSRTFGPAGMDLSAFEGEVLNFLHQTPCAQITQSSHYKVQIEFRKRYLRSLSCLQIYDALFVDIYPGEEGIVDKVAGEAMTHPPILPVFERWVGRHIPWEYERKDYD